jgi:hypothetical protein
MAQRLKKIKVNEVSLVTRPAIAKEFLLYKSEDGAQEAPVMVEEIIKEEQPITEAPSEIVKEEPVITDEVEKGKKNKKEPKPKDGVKKEEEPVVEAPISKEMELAKQLEDERVQKEALIKELDELKKQAEVMKEAEITKEYIAKAAVDMKFVPTVSAAQFGPVLKAAAKKLEKSEFDAIYTALKAANEFIGKNNQLAKELGVGGEDLSGEPAAQLDALAKQMVQKDTSITYAKAYTLACEQHPDIYAQHVRDARRR